MASIDYQGAKTEIENIFAKAGGKRKILFWYDAPRNFEDDIKNDTYSNCKVLICNQNEFEIKKTIEHDDLTSDFLVYIPTERPIDTENWLLDILMYSEEYYADNVALTMRRLNITNTDLRKVIENHIKFFDSEERTKRLSKYININDETSPNDLQVAMMAVLTKANYNTIESILTELVFENGEHNKYNDIKKFRFEDYLWNCICEQYNYDGDLRIDSLIKKFFFSAFVEQMSSQAYDIRNLKDSLASFYQQFLVPEKGINDAKFFVDKIKSDERYESLQSDLATNLKIEGLISTKEIQALQFSDIFECVDADIITRIAQSLNSGSLEFDSFEKTIMNRVNSMWYKKHASEYETLLGSVRFLRYLDKFVVKENSVNEFIEKYAQDYFRIDREYRRVVASYRRIDTTSDEFDELIELIDNSYQIRYLDVLGPKYSEALSKQSDWDFVGEGLSDDFYKYLQRNPAKKIFVIISDALRYEIGYEVYERIRSNKILKGSAEIRHMVSPLPSITCFGMASLLPHKSISYMNKQVLADDMPTNGAEARDKVLKTKNANYAAISYEEINKMTRNELRAYCSDKNLVYIYHDVMDNAGEHSESKVFDVAETCIDEIVNLIKKIYNNLQTSNFYVTADHGFIYRRNEIKESNKYGNIASLQALEISKRYVIADDKGLSVPNTNEFKLNRVGDGALKIIAPWGYDLFKTPGNGLQYVHGGASLQETIVPLIRVSELRSENESTRPVAVRLKSITRKITNRSFTLEFEQTEKVEEKKQPIICETFIVDANNEKVSNEYKFVANSTSDDPETRVTRIRFTLKNIQFDRNKPYFLVLKNADVEDEYIEKEQFVIDIIQFKMF